MVGLSVTKAVYQFEGNPPIDKPVTFDKDAVCGSHKGRDKTAPASKVLTSQFGSWDTISEDNDGGRWLCQACAWAYRAVQYRRTASIITVGTESTVNVTHPTKADLVQTLQRPIPSTTALVIPLSGKKIVLPVAAWGHVATDTKTFRWTPRHRLQLNAALALRAMGVFEPALAEPSPPFYIFDKTPPQEHARIREMWDTLKPVRDDKTMLPFMQNISRKDKA